MPYGHARRKRVKDVLKTVTLLHLQLRHEALDKQDSGSVFSHLIGVEPFITPQLFPQSKTETLLDTFKDNLVLKDDGRQDRIAAPFKTRPQASQSRQSLSQHQSKTRQEGKGKQVWKPNQAKNSGTSLRWKQSSKKNGSEREDQSAQSTKGSLQRDGSRNRRDYRY